MRQFNKKNLLLLLPLLTACSFDISFPTHDSNQASTTPYFQPVSIAYDGPRVDVNYFDVSPAYTLFNGTMWGNGGLFEVEYDPDNNRGFCVDGDTTAFWFPSDIANLITASPKRVRYFNVDTPELRGQNNQPEKWALLATEYVCEMLSDANKIFIQTDPGDKLLDRFGRLLGWIWIDVEGDNQLQLLNYWIVRQGLGEVAYLFGAGDTQATVYQNKTYTEWMLMGESLARQNQYGIHSNLLDPYSN
jgi:endonuclease YncB( thermonuclease family)